MQWGNLPVEKSEPKSELSGLLQLTAALVGLTASAIVALPFFCVLCVLAGLAVRLFIYAAGLMP